MNMKMYHTKFTLSSDYQNHKVSFSQPKSVKIINTKNCKVLCIYHCERLAKNYF